MFRLPTILFCCCYAVHLVQCQIPSDSEEAARQLLLSKFILRAETAQRNGNLGTRRTAPHKARPCYFSPVQCLLRTPGQHQVFQNHPQFNNHFRTKSLRHADFEDNNSQLQRRHHRRHRQNPFLRAQKFTEELLAESQESAEDRPTDVRTDQKMPIREVGKLRFDRNVGSVRQRQFRTPWRIGL